MTLLIITIAIIVAIVIGLWCYGVFWVKYSITANDYPWLEKIGDLQTEEREQWLNAETDQLLKKMTLKEKVAQLSGDGGVLFLVRLGINVLLLGRFPNTYSGRNERLNIPPFSFTDGPRGIVIGRATCFPVAMGRAASWDTQLEQRVASAIGIEARASGANYFGGLCINLLRHPAWGRAQECYGEDPHLMGEFATALLHGVQQHNVMACAKHLAVNNIENSRFYVDVQIDKRTLHEVYLPHFKRCVDEGVASIMSAYNKLNGEYCGHNEYLLNQVLRQQWGFKGFVSSDWLWGIYKTKEAVTAGMDVEMPYNQFLGRKLIRAVNNNTVSSDLIDRNTKRVIRTKLDFITRPDTQSYDSILLACDAHRQLAREAAEQSMVLLKNEAVDNKTILPLQLDPSKNNPIKTIAIIGRLAKEKNLGDHGSSRTTPPEVCTLFEGFKQYLEHHHADINLIYHNGENNEACLHIAKQADTVLMVVGYRHDDEGENLTSNHTPPSAGKKQKIATGGDRLSLSLSPEDRQLIQSVSKVNESCVVNIVSGSAVVTSEWDADVKAILMTWYPGMEGGHAWARLLSGDISPSGKLPFSIPQKESDLVDFNAFSETAVYSYFHGYTHLEKNNTTPQYAFGHGLHYSEFTFSDLTVQYNALNNSIEVSVSITNSGSVSAAEVAQLYVDFTEIEKTNGICRPQKLLKGFTKLFLEPRESKRICLLVDKASLRRFDPESEEWCFDSGQYLFKVGQSSSESTLLTETLVL